MNLKDNKGEVFGFWYNSSLLQISDLLPLWRPFLSHSLDVLLAV